jgi:hypothetical protein
VPDVTALFEFPFPESTDPPDGPAQIQAAVEAIQERLAVIEKLIGTPAEAAEPTPGQLVVVNGTSDPIYRSVTGDVTFNSSGMATIGEEKVATEKIKNLAVSAAKIANLAVSNEKLSLNSVSTLKIQVEAVDENRLAALAVSTAKLANEAVDTGKIKASAVTTAKIAAENITTALIKDGAVTEPKLGDGVVTSRKFKPTAGTLNGTTDLTLSKTEYKDVPGLSVTLELSVKSLVLVTITYGFGFFTGGSSIEEMIGTLNADGANQSKLAFHRTGGELGKASISVSQNYAVTLEPGSRTIKAVAKQVLTEQSCRAFANYNTMQYLVVSA